MSDLNKGFAGAKDTPAPVNGEPGDDLSMLLPDGIPVDEHVEEVSENGEKVRRRGVYLLPNLVTTGALFGGFFAIVSAMNGDFANAAQAIFAAQVLDGFDGRVARMTNTESAFGTEYDSLSDMVSFGLAPAIVLFSWGLEPLGKIGWAAGFVFVVCAAIRLARFNTQVESTDSRFFTGLASPPAATLMASGVWCGSEMELTIWVSVFAALVTTCVGLLMVSNFRYHSFKGLDGDRRVPFIAMLITVMVFVLVMIDPPKVLFLLAFTYALSGPLMWVWSRLKAAGVDTAKDNSSANAEVNDDVNDSVELNNGAQEASESTQLSDNADSVDNMSVDSVDSMSADSVDNMIEQKPLDQSKRDSDE